MIKTIHPSSPLLSKHIECFYLFEGADEDTLSYLAFPHRNNGLSFFKGARLSRSPWKITIESSSEAVVQIELLGKYTRPLLIEYRGKVQEISIVFKPLGINYFFREPYALLAPSYSQELTQAAWNQIGTQLFRGGNDLQVLESFLLEQYQEELDFIKLKPALTALETSDHEQSMTDLAASVGLQLKTFQRLFHKLMACTPVEYKRICRFRNAIATKLDEQQLKNLTAITYEHGYADQSYLIKEFRKLTGHNPKAFFKAARKVDGHTLLWEIL